MKFGFIRRIQNEFRSRVAVVRLRQLGVAQHAAAAKATECAEYVAKLQAWKNECAQKTCPRCGERSRINCCDAKVTDAHLVRMIRRLAGINAKHAGIRDEWIGWKDGKRGFQACGPSAWDNAVRAIEEDQ